MTFAHRRMAITGLAVFALITVGCSTSQTPEPPQVGLIATTVPETPAATADVTLTGDRDVEVTLIGPIAAKYTSATEAQRQALGKPLTGDHNAGTRDSGAVFQQFQNGVIIAKNGAAGTPAYITDGKIREAWNVPRDADGMPAVSGNNGSAGPLGVPTSDANIVGDLTVTTFEHGKVEYNAQTGQVVVTVNDKIVPSGL